MVIICVPEYRFCARFYLYFFLPDNNFSIFFLIKEDNTVMYTIIMQ